MMADDERQIGGEAVAGPSTAVPTMAMPWFMALPFIPKFSGKGGNVKFETWLEQMESMLRAQGLDAQQKVDFVLWGLDGVAKRQVMLLNRDQRGSSRAILDELKRLYGQPGSLAHIRVQFFQCRQKEDESVEMYVLRFKELLNQWKESEPLVVAQVEPTARDQLVKGLKPGKVQRKVERLTRQRPGLSFAEACAEAQALEKEQGQKDEAQAARVFAPPAVDMHELNKWKEQVKMELGQEIRDQLAVISKTLVDEVRRQLPLTGPVNISQGQGESPRGTDPDRRRRGLRSDRDFQWDRNGRPICSACGRPGHIQRYCNQAANVNRRDPLN